MAELGEERDFYQVLGVPRNSPVSRIRTAYLQTMRKYHPDKAGELDYLGHFYEVQKAWEVLKDQKSRTAYDRQLQDIEICYARAQPVFVKKALDQTCRCGMRLEFFAEDQGPIVLQCTSCSEFHVVIGEE